MIILRPLMRLVLVFIFYLVVSPIGMLATLLGRDRLLLRPRNARSSYWRDVSDH